MVTGAGQGVGRGIAMLFARHNARVVVNDYVLDKAESVAEEIRAGRGSAVAAQADVGQLESVRVAVERAAGALGPITILVNNAGMAGPEARMGRSKLFWEKPNPLNGTATSAPTPGACSTAAMSCCRRWSRRSAGGS